MFLALLKFLVFFWLVPVSFVFPKNKKVWVFGAWFGNKYADNTRFLYEAAHNYPEITPVWISKNKKIVEELRGEGKKAFFSYSLYGFFYCMRAGVAFYNCGPTDINEYAIFRTVKIQLWHGIPLKRILYDDEIRYPKNIPGTCKKRLDRILRAMLPARKQNWDYIISSSAYVSNILCSAFWTERKKVVELGYPRHDKMLQKAVAETAASNEKTLLYAPTHRGEGKNYFTSRDFFKGINLTEFNDFLDDNNLKMLVKLHPFHRDSNLLKLDVEALSCIEVISEDCDIYDVIARADVLITDYSSVYIDYLIYNKPIIFYCFDLVSYQSKDRGMYSDYQSTTPGTKCYSWLDVMSELQRLAAGVDNYQDKRNALLEQFFKYKDDHSCDRIIRFLIDHVDLER